MTRISALSEMEAGAALFASAISAARSIRYCSTGAMLGYGFAVPCAHTGAGNRAAMVIPTTVIFMVRLSRVTVVYDYPVQPVSGRPCAVPPCQGAESAVPSDHLATGMTKTVIREVGESLTTAGECSTFAPREAADMCGMKTMTWGCQGPFTSPPRYPSFDSM